MPKGQRRTEAYTKFKLVRQRKDQSVADFITYFKGLEEDIDEHPEASRIQFLLNGFNPQATNLCSSQP